MHGVLDPGSMLFAECCRRFDFNMKIVDASGIFQLVGSHTDASSFRRQFVFAQILGRVKAGTGTE